MSMEHTEHINESTTMEVGDGTDGTLSFEYDTNRVNKSSIKTKHMKFSFTMVKKVCLVLLIAIGVIPGYVLLGQNPTGTTVQDVTLSEIKQTYLANITKQFSLEQNVILSICKTVSSTLIDIRQFVDGGASNTGITLTITQWNALKQISLDVDKHLL